MAKVYIGVGHGGRDAGAVKYLVEKDVNLKMALACRDYLNKAGVETKISRETDKDSSINQKTSEANSWGADLALDIHNNAGQGEGAEVLHSIHYGKGAELAKNILDELTKIGQKSRGTKTKQGSHGDYFGFIRQTNMPAVITECVFVDNQKDAAKADTDAECRAFGEAIAKGVLRTLGMSTSTGTKSDSAAANKPSTEPTSPGFLVRVTASALNIRSGPGTGYKVNGVIRDKGVYTIVETQGSWGRLKSGAGWISLNYTKRV